MPSTSSVPPTARRFATTRWTAVLAAGDPHSPAAAQALDEWDREHAWKRGGRHQFVELDPELAESRYGTEPTLSADQIYDRCWALTVLEQVVARLRAEFAHRGRESLFDQLKACLTGDRMDQPYATLARRLGISESAVKVSVHRLRNRYRELVRDEVAQTVGNTSTVEAELGHLMAILRSS